LITNIIYYNLCYKKSKKYFEETLLEKEKENIPDYNDKLMKEYVDNYNSILENKDKKIAIDNYEKYTLDYFIIDKNNEKNLLYEIYSQFIKNQNDFINKCKGYENIEEIYIQDSNENDILKFKEENLIDIIINCSYVDCLTNDNNIIINGFNFDFDMIEKLIINNMIPGIKKFISGEFGIKQMKYYGEKYNDLNNDIISEFNKKIKSDNLDNEQINKIKYYIETKNKNEVLSILISLQSLMISILEKLDDININDEIKIDENDNCAKLFFENISGNNQEKMINDDQINEKEGLDDYLNDLNEEDEGEVYKVCHLSSIYNICKNEYEKKIN